MVKKSRSTSEPTQPPAKTYESRMYTPHFSWMLVSGIIFLAALIVFGFFINQKFNDSSYPSRIISAARPDDSFDVNWSRYPTFDIELSDSLTITKSGTYHLTGTLSDGQVMINSSNIYVRLILDNVFIHNSSGPAIYSADASKLIIETVGDNYLSDDADYSS